jgi:cytosine deaminase
MRDNGIEVIVLDDPACIEMMEQFQKEHADLWNEDIGR